MISTEVKLYLTRVFGAEGGYTNPPLSRDPGGETKWGICKRSYPDLNIKTLTIEQASDIYLRDFIRPFMDRGIPSSIIYQLTDFAINSGVYGAIKCLQKELGLEDDGILGPKSIACIKAISESDLVMRLIAARLDFMTDLKNWAPNSKGWARRLAKNLRYGAVDTE